MNNNNNTPSKLHLNHARVIWKNFSGKKFNGSRSCGIVIDDHELAQTLIEERWNIKVLPPREGETEEIYVISPEIRYDPFPPHIYEVTEFGETPLTEDTIDELDSIRIDYVSVTINPRVCQDGHIKPYLGSMHVIPKPYDDPYREIYRHGLSGLNKQ